MGEQIIPLVLLGLLSSGVRGLAREKDFYQTTALMPNETKIIKGFLKHMSTSAQNIYLPYLDNILKIQQMQLLYKENGGNDEEAEKFFATNCNIMENLHGAHEKSADPIIAALANRELSILTDDQNMRSFMAFLGLQLLRTKKVKDVFFKNQPRETDLEKFIANATPNIWWFMSYVFGAELGKNLYLDRRNDTHTLLINDTDISFITSDQPVINIHESASNSGINPPEHLDLYYPITPRTAYVILICSISNYATSCGVIESLYIIVCGCAS